MAPIKVDSNTEVWQAHWCLCGKEDRCLVIARSSAEMAAMAAEGDFQGHTVYQTYIVGTLVLHLHFCLFDFDLNNFLLGHGPKSKFNLCRYVCGCSKDFLENQLCEVQTAVGPVLVPSHPRFWFAVPHYQSQEQRFTGKFLIMYSF